MTQDIEKLLSELGIHKTHFNEGVEKARVTITTYGNARFEEGVKAERERIVAWAKDRIDPMEPKYEEAMHDLIAHLSDK